MAKAAIVELADEVAADLTRQSGGWVCSFKAERVYVPVVELKQTDVLKVHTAFAGWRETNDNRDSDEGWLAEFDIEIGVQYRASEKAASQATAKFDDCTLLIQQIADYYKTTRPTLSDCPLKSDGVAIGPGGNGLPFIPEHIEQLNQFTGVIRLTFQKWR